MVVLVLPVVVIFIGWPTPMSPASGGRLVRWHGRARLIRGRTLLANAAFWTMVLPIAIALLAQMGFIIHQVTFLEPLIGRASRRPCGHRSWRRWRWSVACRSACSSTGSIRGSPARRR